LNPSEFYDPNQPSGPDVGNEYATLYPCDGTTCCLTYYEICRKWDNEYIVIWKKESIIIIDCPYDPTLECEPVCGG